LTTPAERIAGAALIRVLAPVSVGTPIAESEALHELLEALERYLPAVLQRAYPEAWRFEGLDGLYLARATKTGPRTVELTGMCLLITDQALTPFQVSLRAAESTGQIEWVHCRLGERTGNGLLRIPYASTEWRKRLHLLKISTIEWVYDIEAAALDRT
jgi:hypothetical protein